MGTYYRYVNHTRREFVRLSGVRRGGGDKDAAAIWCGGVLAYLLMPGGREVDAYRGRWGSRLQRDPPGGGSFSLDLTIRDAQAVAVVSDAPMDINEIADLYDYVDITRDLVDDMRRNGFWTGYAHAADAGR